MSTFLKIACLYLCIDTGQFKISHQISIKLHAVGDERRAFSVLFFSLNPLILCKMQELMFHAPVKLRRLELPSAVAGSLTSIPDSGEALLKKSYV